MTLSIAIDLSFFSFAVSLALGFFFMMPLTGAEDPDATVVVVTSTLR